MGVKTHPVVPHLYSLGTLNKPIPLRLADKLRQHSIHKELQTAWIALKAIGLLPLFVKQPPVHLLHVQAASGGRRIFNYALQATYAIGFYLAFCYYALDRALWIINKISRNQNNSPNVLFLMNSTLLVTHVLIGPLQWIRMPKVLRFLKDWDAFQEYYLMVTQQPLQLNMVWTSSIFIVFAVAGCIGGALLIAFLVYDGDVVGSLYYMYAGTQISVLLAVWVLLCLASVRAAKQLAGRLKEDLANSGEIRNNLINEYHSAWLRLSQLTRDIGDVFCHVFNVIVIFWLTEMLLTAFQGAKLFVNGCPMGMLIGISGLAINSFVSIQVFCFAGNYATEGVSTNFLKYLTDIQVEITEVQKELHDFVQAVATHGAVITLGGFYVVDRSLIVSIMSAFATFMVVLCQSAPDADGFECAT